jgi:hypothetical protein
MPRKAYVVDLAIADFAAAVADFRTVFGIEGIPMWEEYEPTGNTWGMHFPVGGLQAFGLMSPKKTASGRTAMNLTEVLATRGEGMTLIGFVAPDLAATQAELQRAGVRFVAEQPWHVGDENINMTEQVHGVTLAFAQHDIGHWERWERGEIRAQHALPVPAPARPLRRRVQRALGIDIAVQDVDTAADDFARVLGSAQPVAAAELADGLRGVDFAIAGLQRIRLVSVQRPVGPRAQLVSECLQRRGAGVMLMEFLVEDAARTQAELAVEGVAFLPGPIRRTATAICACTQPIHGLAVEFVQSL